MQVVTSIFFLYTFYAGASILHLPRNRTSTVQGEKIIHSAKLCCSSQPGCHVTSNMEIARSGCDED